MSKTKHILSVIAFGTFIFAAVASGSDEKETDKNKATSGAEAPAEKAIGLSELLQTEYFSVKVNKFDFKDRVSTGNEFADLKKEDGNKYIIINVTLKNTDAESRMMFDGELLVKNGDKAVKYENAEPVMAEGWGVVMDNINPGVTKTTNIVYKVPADLKGDVYYVPSRSTDGQIIKVAAL